MSVIITVRTCLGSTSDTGRTDVCWRIFASALKKRSLVWYALSTACFVEFCDASPVETVCVAPVLGSITIDVRASAASSCRHPESGSHARSLQARPRPQTMRSTALVASTTFLLNTAAKFLSLSRTWMQCWQCRFCAILWC